MALKAVTGKKNPALSNPEIAALLLVDKGASDNEIACALNVSETTAYRNIENARRKLGADTREDAVALALKLKLLERV